jgi:hypothetical protein
MNIIPIFRNEKKSKEAEFTYHFFDGKKENHHLRGSDMSQDLSATGRDFQVQRKKPVLFERLISD